MGKEYVLEALLLKKDAKRVQQYYIKDMYINENFFRRGGEDNIEQREKCVLEALQFLAKEVKQ